MVWVLVSLAVLARGLGLRLVVPLGMLALWFFVLWVQSGPQGPHLALALFVVTLVGVMVAVDKPWTRGRR